MRNTLTIGAAALFALTAATTAVAEEAVVDYAAEIAALGGDAEKGEKVFKKCKSCHVFDEGKKKTGPHLVGDIGRPAAAVDGFRYSKNMKKFGEEGGVWNNANLQEYLTKPRKFIKGTRMSFAGLKKEQDRNDVITYLLQEGGAHKAE